MKKLLAIVFVLVVTSNLSFAQQAEELEDKKVYRLNKTVHNIEETKAAGVAGLIAGMNSKFIVVFSSDPNFYVVRFLKIYDVDSETPSTIREDEEYKLMKTIGGVPISTSVDPSLTGPVSGPLIVPFKYRLDDKSITGEATLGYYAGYRTELGIWGTNERIPISPFIAGGVSPISVSENGDTETKTGFTLAAGILVQNWSGVNIGIVYGQDRTGNQSWEHEGEGWFSFMIGWNL